MSHKAARWGMSAAFMVAVVLGGTNIGCAHIVGKQYRVSDELVEREGIRYFHGAYADVFIAAHEGLSELGFAVEKESPTMGRLVTNQLIPYSDMRGTTAAREYVSLEVDVAVIEPGLVAVRVLPRRYTGVEKAETYQYWRSEAWIENYWHGLFDSIAKGVGSPAQRPQELAPEQAPLPSSVAKR